MIIPKREEFEEVIQGGNITIEGKKPQMNAANLVWDLTDVGGISKTINQIK